MNDRKKILLADNSSEYRLSVIGFLELEGYLVVEAGTPEEAKEKLELKEFDLVLADLRMRDDDDGNDMGGLEIAKFASECGIPCIIATAFPTVELARIALRSRGAEPFAQDLITKGSGPQALMDSISLTLHSKDPKPVQPVEEGLVIDLDKELVRKNGLNIDVSPKQFRLLAELRRKDGGVCSCVDLIRAIYQEELGEKAAQNDKRLRNLVERTKDKIEDKGSSHEYIEAVSGRGYRLNLKK
jgi:DNA-binding response OmpR family regulator